MAGTGALRAQCAPWGAGSLRAAPYLSWPNMRQMNFVVGVAAECAWPSRVRRKRSTPYSIICMGRCICRAK